MCHRGSPSGGVAGRSLEAMLRLLDARTGSYAEVRPARRGLLRVSAQVPGSAGQLEITGLRVLLAADLLFRVAELGNLQVLTVLTSDGESRGQLMELGHAADALGIHPPAARASSRDAHVALGGPIDVHLASHRPQLGDEQKGLVVFVGAARMPETDGQAPDGSLPAGFAPDPLAIRLALMSYPPGTPAELTGSVLARACQTAESWRLRVAQWAQWPSKPVPAHLAQAVRAAFDDLDTVSVLALLRDLADDDSVPAGARFETFLYADRILSLDLPRDIGRLGG